MGYCSIQCGFQSSFPENKNSHVECSICQYKIYCGMYEINCKHKFHRKCLFAHIKETGEKHSVDNDKVYWEYKCPNCRAKNKKYFLNNLIKN